MMNAPHLESGFSGKVTEFSLTTTDGQSHLQGDVWFPSRKSPAGAVVIVPGGWNDKPRRRSASREAEYFQSRTPKLRCAPKCTVHKQRGHAFGIKKPLVGPMDPAAEDMFAAELPKMIL